MNSSHEQKLTGVHAVVTRPAEQAQELVTLLREQGAQVSRLPCIRIEPLAGAATFVRAYFQSTPAEWIVFTSANAAIALRQALAATGIRLPAEYRFAAIGRKTAQAAVRQGFEIAFCETARNVEAFAADFYARHPEITHVLYPCSKAADQRLEAFFAARQVEVDRVELYEPVAAVQPEALAAVLRHRPDVFLFHSSSAVRSFFRALEPGNRATALAARFAAIGQTTAGALRSAGVSAPLIAARPTSDALLAELIRAFAPTDASVQP